MANVVPYAFKQGILKAQHDFTTIVGNPGAGGAGQGTNVTGAYKLALYTFNSNTPPFDVNSTIFSAVATEVNNTCLLYTSPSPRDRTRSRMPSSA